MAQSKRTSLAPKPNEIWYARVGTTNYLILINEFPVDPRISPYPNGTICISFSFPDFWRQKQTWHWTKCTDTYKLFITYARPATQADWILYANKGWDHLKTKDGFLLEGRTVGKA